MDLNGEEKAIAIKIFQYLWKAEDKEWLSQRKSKWKIIQKSHFKKTSAGELNVYKKYYLTGERDEYIPPATLFLLTPFGSVEEANKFFVSPACGDPERLLSGFVVIYANSNIEGNVLRPHVVFLPKVYWGRNILKWREGLEKTKKPYLRIHLSGRDSIWGYQSNILKTEVKSIVRLLMF